MDSLPAALVGMVCRCIAGTTATSKGLGAVNQTCVAFRHALPHAFVAAAAQDVDTDPDRCTREAMEEGVSETFLDGINFNRTWVGERTRRHGAPLILQVDLDAIGRSATQPQHLPPPPAVGVNHSRSSATSASVTGTGKCIPAVSARLATPHPVAAVVRPTRSDAELLARLAHRYRQATHLQLRLREPLGVLGASQFAQHAAPHMLAVDSLLILGPHEFALPPVWRLPGLAELAARVGELSYKGHHSGLTQSQPQAPPTCLAEELGDVFPSLRVLDLEVGTDGHVGVRPPLRRRSDGATACSGLTLGVPGGLEVLLVNVTEYRDSGGAEESQQRPQVPFTLTLGGDPGRVRRLTVHSWYLTDEYNVEQEDDWHVPPRPVRLQGAAMPLLREVEVTQEGLVSGACMLVELARMAPRLRRLVVVTFGIRELLEEEGGAEQEEGGQEQRGLTNGAAAATAAACFREDEPGWAALERVLTPEGGTLGQSLREVAQLYTIIKEWGDYGRNVVLRRLTLASLPGVDARVETLYY